MPYEDHVPKIFPPWLRGRWGAAYGQGLGRRMDAIVQLFRDASQARLPLPTQAADALDQIGRDRQLPRGSGESDSAYGARLKDAWNIWGGDNTPITGKGGGAGSHLGMLNAIKAAGIPTGATGATIVQQNGRYAQLDGSGNLVLGSLMNCVNRLDLTGAILSRPGWTFDARDGFYSIFAIVFPTSTSLNAGLLNAIVEKWRPSKALYLGALVITAGRMLGWPTGRTLGTDPNLGGNTRTFHAGANGDHSRIGYTP